MPETPRTTDYDALVYTDPLALRNVAYRLHDLLERARDLLKHTSPPVHFENVCPACILKAEIDDALSPYELADPNPL